MVPESFTSVTAEDTSSESIVSTLTSMSEEYVLDQLIDGSESSTISEAGSGEVKNIGQNCKCSYLI